MDLNFCHRLPIQIYYEDTDAGGVVYHANYLKYYERGRTEWLRAQGVQQAVLKSVHALVFVVTEATVRFLRPAHFDETLEVRTWISEIKGSRLIFTQQLVGKLPKLSIPNALTGTSFEVNAARVVRNQAQVSIACVDTRTWRSQRMSTFFTLFGESVVFAAENFSPLVQT